MPSMLVGTIIARHQLFATLPTELQEDTMQFRSYVETDKRWLFRKHHPALVKSVYGVKGSELIDVIIHWLQTRSVPPAPSVSTAAVADFNADQPQGARSRAATASFSNTTHQGTKDELECAKKIAEALVLMGFITPFKGDEKRLTSNVPGHYVHENELLIPVASSVSELTTTTVWSVLDGAVYARPLKRKAGLMGKITDGKDVYVVFNDKTKKLYVFANDLALQPLAELSGPMFDVQFDNSRFEFGVRVDLKSGLEKEKPEFFNAETESVQLEFLLACLGIGASYAEGNVKKLIEMVKRGLTVCDAPPRDKYKSSGMATEPHEVAKASVADATISERKPESNSKTPYNVAFADAPTSAKHRGHPESEVPTSSAGQGDGSYPTSFEPGSHRLGGRSLSTGPRGQHVDSRPTAAKYDEYPIGAFSNPAAAP